MFGFLFGYNQYGLNWIQLITFPTSWVFFFVLGKLFFETGLGQYHATHSKHLAIFCKGLFLFTFTVACTLLELVTFEIVQFLHPTLRQLAWETLLALLCVLQNVIIPSAFAISLARNFFPSSHKLFSILCGLLSVLGVQYVMWIVDGVMPAHIDKPVSSTTFFSLGVSRFMRDTDDAWGFGGGGKSYEWITHLIEAFEDCADFLLLPLLDVQQSVMHIAVVGIALAAVMSGFASVFFPLEQMMVDWRAVQPSQLVEREQSLQELLRVIAKKKKLSLLKALTAQKNNRGSITHINNNNRNRRRHNNNSNVYSSRSSGSGGDDDTSGSRDQFLRQNQQMNMLEQVGKGDEHASTATIQGGYSKRMHIVYNNNNHPISISNPYPSALGGWWGRVTHEISQKIRFFFYSSAGGGDGDGDVINNNCKNSNNGNNLTLSQQQRQYYLNTNTLSGCARVRQLWRRVVRYTGGVVRYFNLTIFCIARYFGLESYWIQCQTTTQVVCFRCFRCFRVDRHPNSCSATTINACKSMGGSVLSGVVVDNRGTKKLMLHGEGRGAAEEEAQGEREGSEKHNNNNNNNNNNNKMSRTPEHKQRGVYDSYESPSSYSFLPPCQGSAIPLEGGNQLLQRRSGGSKKWNYFDPCALCRDTTTTTTTKMRDRFEFGDIGAAVGDPVVVVDDSGAVQEATREREELRLKSVKSKNNNSNHNGNNNMNNKRDVSESGKTGGINKTLWIQRDSDDEELKELEQQQEQLQQIEGYRWSESQQDSEWLIERTIREREGEECRSAEETSFCDLTLCVDRHRFGSFASRKPPVSQNHSQKIDISRSCVAETTGFVGNRVNERRPRGRSSTVSCLLSYFTSLCKRPATINNITTTNNNNNNNNNNNRMWRRFHYHDSDEDGIVDDPDNFDGWSHDFSRGSSTSLSLSHQPLDGSGGYFGAKYRRGGGVGAYPAEKRDTSYPSYSYPPASFDNNNSSARMEREQRTENFPMHLLGSVASHAVASTAFFYRLIVNRIESVLFPGLRCVFGFFGVENISTSIGSGMGSLEPQQQPQLLLRQLKQQQQQIQQQRGGSASRNLASLSANIAGNSRGSGVFGSIPRVDSTRSVGSETFSTWSVCNRAVINNNTKNNNRSKESCGERLSEFGETNLGDKSGISVTNPVFSECGEYLQGRLNDSISPPISPPTPIHHRYDKAGSFLPYFPPDLYTQTTTAASSTRTPAAELHSPLERGGGGFVFWEDDDVNIVPKHDFLCGRDREMDIEVAVLADEITSLEQLSKELFLELVYLRELQYQEEYSHTTFGRVLKYSGQLFTLMGVVRFVSGMWHVCSYFAGQKRFTSREIGLNGATTAATTTTGGGERFASIGVGYNNNYNSGERLAAVDGATDLVTLFLTFTQEYLPIELDANVWLPWLSTLFIGVLTLLYIRGFLITTQNLARTGFFDLATRSTELFALTLAYLTCAYFIACVVLLRCQLPLRYRRGISFALGDQMPYAYYMWLFDVFFTVSCTLSALFLWMEFEKKSKLKQRSHFGERKKERKGKGK